VNLEGDSFEGCDAEGVPVALGFGDDDGGLGGADADDHAGLAGVESDGDSMRVRLEGDRYEGQQLNPKAFGSRVACLVVGFPHQRY